MFRNLRAEMARYGISTEELAQAIGISRQALSSKMNGKTRFMLEEVRAVRDYINGKGGNFTADELFMETTI